MMRDFDPIHSFFLNKIQTFEITKSGTIISSNNLLFTTIIGQQIHELHPFFEILNDILDADDSEVQFNAIQLEVQDTIIIADIIVFTGSESQNPTILVFNNTENYDVVQEITQQKNEVFIANFFKTQKLIRNDEERLLKNEFLASITNDLKTPISAISGLLELFQKENLTFDQVELLKIIRNSMSHLTRLVNDVLDLSKSEIGQLNIELKSFDFDDVIKNIEKLFLNKFLLKGIDFQIVKSERIPKYLIGDKDRLLQILINLLENACKYTEKGRVIFEIKIDTTSPSKIGLDFSISDTGVGIEDSVKNRLFHSFKKTDDTTKTSSGVGLSIVGNLVKLLKGSVKVQSELNVGTMFNVFLSFVIDITNERKIKLNEVVFKKINFQKKISVLIVDDNEINQLVLMKLLINHEGFFIDIANTPQRALEMISKNNYNLLFVDLNMSAMQGMEVISSIRGHENNKIKKTPIISLSGSESETEKKKCKQLKVNHYLVKPYTNQDLFQAIYKNSKLLAK